MYVTSAWITVLVNFKMKGASIRQTPDAASNYVPNHLDNLLFFFFFFTLFLLILSSPLVLYVRAPADQLNLKKQDNNHQSSSP